MDKQKIREGFSRAARQYDRHAWLPQEVGQKLLRRVVNSRGRQSNILDIGCGTGAFTIALSHKVKKARLIGFDLAEGMIKIASSRKGRNGEIFLQADLENMPFKNSSFDIIVSNLVYQRINDLPKAFKKVNRILAPGGKFYLSLMTQGTLGQLQSSFISACRKTLDYSPQEAYRHPTPFRIIKALKGSGFKRVRAEKFKKIKYYSQPEEIINWLKSIGANYYYRSLMKGLCFRKVLREMGEIYKERYGRSGKIPATFCGLIIEAEK